MFNKKMITAAIVFSLCITACGNAKSSEVSAAEQPKINSENQNTKTAEKTEEKKNIPVLIGGGLPFTGMKNVALTNNSDGSYYYEDITEDGLTTVINCSFPSTKLSDEYMEDYVLRALLSKAGYNVQDISVNKNDTYSSKLGCPVYIVKCTSGRNENKRYWTAYVAEAYGYTYLYAFNVCGNAAEGTDEIINSIFSRLEFFKADDSTEHNGAWTLDDVRAEAKSKGFICSAVALGYGIDIQSFIAQTDLTDYPFIVNIPKERYVETADSGDEIYCIIPTDTTSSVAVNEWLMNENNGYYGESGNILYKSESGEPILLRANISDVVPDKQVVIVNSSGEVLDWNPALSLYDGKLVTPWYSPGVLDITVYDGQPFFGWWSYSAQDGSEMVMVLNFQRLGNHMSYSCGYGNSELISYYNGTWSIDTQRKSVGKEQYITFAMRNPDNPEDTFWGTYSVESIDDTHIDIKYISGNKLYDGMGQNVYRFEWDSY